jgi:hypothetical protein
MAARELQLRTLVVEVQALIDSSFHFPVRAAAQSGPDGTKSGGSDLAELVGSYGKTRLDGTVKARPVAGGAGVEQLFAQHAVPAGRSDSHEMKNDTEQCQDTRSCDPLNYSTHRRLLTAEASLHDWPR